VVLQPGGAVSFPDVGGRNVFLYLASGAVRVAGEAAQQHRLVELSGDGETVDIVADTAAVLLFGHAQPIGEPVVAHGPFVMNTRQEIQQAARDYMDGKFGEVPG
jgi:redox-sensitive bicupin YhaK (pirin superfamily)